MTKYILEYILYVFALYRSSCNSCNELNGVKIFPMIQYERISNHCCIDILSPSKLNTFCECKWCIMPTSYSSHFHGYFKWVTPDHMAWVDIHLCLWSSNNDKVLPGRPHTRNWLLSLSITVDRSEFNVSAITTPECGFLQFQQHYGYIFLKYVGYRLTNRLCLQITSRS